MTITVQFLRNARDNIIDRGLAETYTWPELVETFAQHSIGDKDGLAFVAALYLPPEDAVPATLQGVEVRGSVGRRKANITHVTALVLDYDGGQQIAAVQKTLEGIRHFGYTSHSHLKDGATPRFRVVIPLAEPCPIAEWDARIPNIRTLFPGIDASTVDAGRLFYTPRAAQDRLQDTRTWSAEGDPFDWRCVAEAVLILRDYTPTVLDHDDVFRQAVLGQVAKCSFHDYKDWLALGGRLHNAGFCLLDYQALSEPAAAKACAEWWNKLEMAAPTGMGPLMKRIRQEFPDWRPPVQAATLDFVRGERKDEPRELVTVDQRQFQPLTESGQRKRLVKQFLSSFEAVGASHAVIRTAEGYGKTTTIVSQLLDRGQHVMLCCLSHQQVKEKLASFAKYSPVRAVSLRALLEEELGVAPVYGEKANPWKEPKMDMEATEIAVAKKLRCSTTEAQEAIHELRNHVTASRTTGARLVVTTFQTGSSIFKQAYGCTDRVIVVDDASMSDLTLCQHAFADGDEDAKAQIVVAERTVEDTIFGNKFAFQDPIIWTTTEKLVAACIQKHHPGTFITDIVENIDTGHRILMVPTNLVRKLTKKVLPGIHAAVQDDCSHPVRLLSNGRISETNLVNTKGRNDLAEDTVVAISFPHPSDVANVTVSLGHDLYSPEFHEVQRQMVVDVMDQALGRSQGYRNVGTNALVLIDPQLEIAARSRSRYRLHTIDGIKRRGRLNGCPLVWAPDWPEWWSLWQAYLTTWEKHVVVIGSKIFETFTMRRIEFTEDDAKVIKKRLEKPTQFTEYVWRKVHEVVEGNEESRRNFSIVMNELVSKFNCDRRGEGNATGKLKYVNSADPNAKAIRCMPGTAPPGWITAPVRRATGKSRGRPRKVTS